jgi:hypothetical protein
MLSTVSGGEAAFEICFDLVFFNNSSFCLMRMDCLLEGCSSSESPSRLESFLILVRVLSVSDSEVEHPAVASL